MGTKFRSILLLIVIFIMGTVSGFFIRGLYDHYRWEYRHHHKTEKRDKSRFVGFFSWIIKPSPEQTPSVETVLEKWDKIMSDLQTQFGRQSEEKFKEMVAELTPLLNEAQLIRLKKALDEFGRHRRSSSKKLKIS